MRCAFLFCSRVGWEGNERWGERKKGGGQRMDKKREKDLGEEGLGGAKEDCERRKEGNLEEVLR